jgi:hypothetical protein
MVEQHPSRCVQGPAQCTARTQNQLHTPTIWIKIARHYVAYVVPTWSGEDMSAGQVHFVLLLLAGRSIKVGGLGPLGLVGLGVPVVHLALLLSMHTRHTPALVSRRKCCEKGSLN